MGRIPGSSWISEAGRGHRWMGSSQLGLISLLLLALFITPALPQSPSHREVSAIIGDVAILPCSVDILGSQHILWRDPNSEMLTINEQRMVDDTRISVVRPYVKEWNLKIKDLRKTDQGTYTCVINTMPIQSKLVTLWVRFPPTIDEHSERELPVRVGDSVTMTCKASGFPDPEIKWYKFMFNNEKKEIGAGVDTWTIRNISREDGGTYECEADNGVSPADKRTFKVDIKYAPEIQLPYRRISQQLGRDTLLECMITANPITSHYWAKDGRRLEASDKYRIQTWDVGEFTRTLGAFIFKLEPSDFGMYTCVATNDFGRDEGNLTVYEYQLGEIRITKTPIDAVRQRGQGVQFDCLVEGLSYKDALTWWHVTSWGMHRRLFVSHPDSQGHHITYLDLNKYEIRGHYSLYIKNASLDDAGTYVCQVTGQKNHSAQLTVVESPHCEMNSSVVQEGSQALLICSLWFAGVPLNWQVEWHHGDRKLSTVNEDVSGKVNRFISFLATPKDAGVYYCKIKSQQPEFMDQCRTTLTVKRPEYPTDQEDLVCYCPSPETHVPPGAVCQDTSTMITTNVAMVILAAGTGGLLILFVCILTAVVINFKRQIRKYTRGQRSAVRYKNGNVTMETDALTKDNDHTEVDV